MADLDLAAAIEAAAHAFIDHDRCAAEAAVRAAAPLIERAARDKIAAEQKAEIAEVVREIVGIATDPNGPTPEWLNLIAAVNEGHYTPPQATATDPPASIGRTGASRSEEETSG